MIRFAKPSADLLRRFLDAQARLPHTYDAVGATRGEGWAGNVPKGFVVDHTRACLGSGARTWLAANHALREWRQFHLGWVEPWPTDVPLLPGKVVAIVARIGPVYWLNACRITCIDEVRDAPIEYFSFSNGTLPGHAERGEERFRIEWHHADDSVWYDILAFSRPHHVLARLGYPVVRLLQKRFARDSVAAMRRATATP
ncbi:MAG: DUF1990 domain-containing protein [Pirellulales bacterium]|nr:DUF1990 domain-containing protein [Pirellulales bacterium]